ncbi:CHASE3 domain-containing protein [Vitiosangium sp. GDMCC 1.1324]|uniref:CHASE3 domain-containing protein n=1 Tax=Vitiosangium sp. (strain GDMCC 1.1324) TaxID=2138576 RepID=UPI000D34A0AE|nr:CHASE3 domain-containing protein [Vitiosangium sp. GDMCC 1.1324]PTL78256.1 chemotaxis protein [Vitiosangium sp. GDMCC 1.1324]
MLSRWTVGRQFFVGFLLVTSLIGIFIFLTRQRTQAFAEASTLVSRSHKTLSEIERFLTIVKDAESGQRDYILTGNDAYLEPYRQATGALAKEFAALREFIADNPEQVRRLEVLKELVDQKMVSLRTTIEVRRTQGFEPALASINSGEGKQLMDAIRKSIAEMQQQEATLLATRDGQQEEDVRAFNQFFWIDGLGILVFVLLTAMLIGKNLERKLQTAIAQVQGSSTELHSAASQQVTGAREQASATTEISTTVKELLSTSRQIASSAQQVARVADDTAGAARTGNETVQRAQDAIDTVNRQVDAIVNHMLELGKRSQEIGGILDIINELAEQTNILAINATIESAGAGENGKRFAVVAEEIRKLADRVGGATKDIRVLIDEIRAASNTTIMATEDGSKAVQSSAKQFSDVAGNFRRIAELVRANLDVAREIEMSTQQQTTAVEQVNIAILEVAQTAQQSEVSSTQTLQTANRLTQLSQQLSAILDAKAAA